jgi:hypothetical protein
VIYVVEYIFLKGTHDLKEEGNDDNQSLGPQQLFEIYENNNNGNWIQKDPIGDKLKKVGGDDEIDGTIINFTKNEKLEPDSILLVIKCNNKKDICNKIKKFLQKKRKKNHQKNHKHQQKNHKHLIKTHLHL